MWWLIASIPVIIVFMAIWAIVDDYKQRIEQVEKDND
jgi:hypothetical protein